VNADEEARHQLWLAQQANRQAFQRALCVALAAPPGPLLVLREQWRPLVEQTRRRDRDLAPDGASAPCGVVNG
jgi:hypothetical protein